MVLPGGHTTPALYRAIGAIISAAGVSPVRDNPLYAGRSYKDFG